MEDRARLLIENMGCEEGQARLALALYDSVEEAMRNFESVMNDIEIIKAKIKTSDTGIYGLFVAIVDASQKKIIRLGAVLTTNSAVDDTNITGNWFILERKIYTIRLSESSLQNATQELEQLLFNSLQYEKEKHFFEALQQGNNKDVKAILTEVIKNVPSLPKLRLELKIEKLGKAYHRRRKNKFVEVSSDEIEGTVPEIRSQIELKVDLVKGSSRESMPAFLLSHGDRVMAEVIDDRDVAGYISRLLGGIQKDSYVPLFSVVEDISNKGDFLVVKVRFSAGITGTAVINLKEKVMIVQDRGNIFGRWMKKIFVDITSRIRYN